MQLKEKARSTENNKAQVDLQGGDKLYLVSGGVLYDVPFPDFGNLEAVIVDGKIVDIEYRMKMRLPGRNRRDRDK